MHVQNLNVKSDFNYAHRIAEVNEPQRKQGQKQKKIEKQMITNTARYKHVENQTTMYEKAIKTLRTHVKPTWSGYSLNKT